MKKILQSILMGVTLIGAISGCDNSDSKNYKQIKNKEQYNKFSNPSEREEDIFQQSIREHPEWYGNPLERIKEKNQ